MAFNVFENLLNCLYKYKLNKQWICHYFLIILREKTLNTINMNAIKNKQEKISDSQGCKKKKERNFGLKRVISYINIY